MILNRGPPSGFETSNKISNSGGTDMYIEHPYFYEGKYYANIDGEMIEITKEVAYAMNNFYRSSKISDNPAPQKQGHSAAWPPPVNRNAASGCGIVSPPQKNRSRSRQSGESLALRAGKGRLHRDPAR